MIHLQCLQAICYSSQDKLKIILLMFFNTLSFLEVRSIMIHASLLLNSRDTSSENTAGETLTYFHSHGNKSNQLQKQSFDSCLGTVMRHNWLNLCAVYGPHAFTACPACWYLHTGRNSFHCHWLFFLFLVSSSKWMFERCDELCTCVHTSVFMKQFIQMH